MTRRSGSVMMAVVAVAICLCGLLLFRGVAPDPVGDQLTGIILPAVAPPATEPTPTSEPADPSSTTTTSIPTTTIPTTTIPTTTIPTTTIPTTTTTETTTTTSTTSTTTTTAPVNAGGVFPTDVAASTTVVGPGGLVDFSGSCPTVDGEPRGPLVVWQIGRTIEVIPTGVSSAAWSFTWTAPIDTADVGGYTFQFWCGVPETGAAGYPVDLQITVDMVMQSLPAAPTTSTPLVEAPPNPAIPETN